MKMGTTLSPWRYDVGTSKRAAIGEAAMAHDLALRRLRG
jgi:hypothetical protein